MIKLMETKDIDIISSVIYDPKLFKSSHGHTDIPADKPIDHNYKYIAIIKDKRILGCFQIREMTKLVLEVHIHLLPEHWGTGISADIAKAGNKWAREQGYTQLFTKVPANAIHTLKYLDHIGYTACGMIEKAIIFHNYLVSIFFFVLDLEHTKI